MRIFGVYFFTTGYLTQRERIDSRKLRLAIPNREIKELFELQIREWFQEKSSEDVKKLDKLCMAFSRWRCRNDRRFV